MSKKDTCHKLKGSGLWCNGVTSGRSLPGTSSNKVLTWSGTILIAVMEQITIARFPYDKQTQVGCVLIRDNVPVVIQGGSHS